MVLLRLHKAEGMEAMLLIRGAKRKRKSERSINDY
jgi:hypothetical protein